MQSENDLPTLVRFEDLRQRGIVTTWQGLRHLQAHAGFPLGRLLGPASRAWTTDEVNAWLASRPTEPSRQTRERAAKSVKARRLPSARDMLDGAA
jgi:hypothetical protein